MNRCGIRLCDFFGTDLCAQVRREYPEICGRKGEMILARGLAIANYTNGKRPPWPSRVKDATRAIDTEFS